MAIALRQPSAKERRTMKRLVQALVRAGLRDNVRFRRDGVGTSDIPGIRARRDYSIVIVTRIPQNTLSLYTAMLGVMIQVAQNPSRSLRPNGWAIGMTASIIGGVAHYNLYIASVEDAASVINQLNWHGDLPIPETA